MSKQKKISAMQVVPIESDITSFLIKVQEEVNAIYNRYDLPRNLYQKRGLNLADALALKKHGELLNHSEEMGLPLTYDLYQAGYVSYLIGKSEKYLISNEAENLTYHVGLILETMSSKDGQTRLIAGKGRAGYEGVFTSFIKEVIEFTKRERAVFTAKYVIGNIDQYYDDNETRYYPQLILEKSDDGYKYSENGNNERHVGTRSLITKINNIRKNSK